MIAGNILFSLIFYRAGAIPSYFVISNIVKIIITLTDYE